SRDASGNPIPTTTTSLEQLLAQAKAKGCSRLYLYITAHGANGSICLWNRVQFYDGYPYEFLDYTTLGQLLLPFTQMNVDTVVILDACHAGSAANSLFAGRCQRDGTYRHGPRSYHSDGVNLVRRLFHISPNSGLAGPGRRHEWRWPSGWKRG